MNSARCLLVSVALALTSIGCSTPRTVTATLPAPAACLMRCDPLTPPARPGDNLGRVLWELQMIDDHATCAALHDECAAEALRRLMDQ